jgi:hypothetical protein
MDSLTLFQASLAIWIGLIRVIILGCDTEAKLIGGVTAANHFQMEF